ncbi:MAG: YraN family protein [Candidatus Latescibacteria bacterium]|nr:YraN family protein [bacterium]MBD3422884.1 YraN family protein [Candidatus Latescibacterota bacterium]
MRGENVDAGGSGEEIAARYLLLSGYRILERNYRAGRLEIDIIAERDRCLVFAEVKMRRSSTFGSALESILPKKLDRIRDAALAYLSEKGFGTEEEIRIDLIAIDLESDKKRMILNHLQGVT